MTNRKKPMNKNKKIPSFTARDQLKRTTTTTRMI